MKFYISILLFLINIFSLYAYEKEKCYRIDDIQNFIEHHPKKTHKNELLLVELTINRVNIDVYIPKLDQKKTVTKIYWYFLVGSFLKRIGLTKQG